MAKKKEPKEKTKVSWEDVLKASVKGNPKPKTSKLKKDNSKK